jgi:hypothetical protein
MKPSIIAWLICIGAFLVFAKGIQLVNEATWGLGQFYEFDPRGNIIVMDYPTADGIDIGFYDIHQVQPFTTTLPVGAVLTDTLVAPNPDDVRFLAMNTPAVISGTLSVQGYQFKRRKGYVASDIFTYTLDANTGPLHQHWLCDNMYGTVQEVNTDGTTAVTLYNRKMREKRSHTIDDVGLYGAHLSDCGDYVVADSGLGYGEPNLDLQVYKIGGRLKEQDSFAGQPYTAWPGDKDRVIVYTSHELQPTPHTMWNVRDVKTRSKVAELPAGGYLSYAVNTRGRPSVSVIWSNQTFEVLSAKKDFGPFPVPDWPGGYSASIALHRGRRVVLLFYTSGEYELRAYKVRRKGLKQIGDTVRGTELMSVESSSGDLVVLETVGMQRKATVYKSSLKRKGEVMLDARPFIKGKAIGEPVSDEHKVRVYRWN